MDAKTLNYVRQDIARGYVAGVLSSLETLDLTHLTVKKPVAPPATAYTSTAQLVQHHCRQCPRCHRFLGLGQEGLAPCPAVAYGQGLVEDSWNHPGSPVCYDDGAAAVRGGGGNGFEGESHVWARTA